MKAPAPFLTRHLPPLRVLLTAALLHVASATAFSAPANDHFANAQILSGSSATASGDSAGATREAGEREHGYRSVWYAWTAPGNVQVTITTPGTAFTAILAVYQGDAADRLNLVAADDNGSPRSVTFPAAQGTTFRIAIAAYYATNSVNTFGLAIATKPLTLSGNLFGPPAPTSTGPTNDAFAAPQALSGAQLTAIGYTGDATAQLPIESENGYRTIWYTWTAPADVTATIQASGSPGTAETGFRPFLSVYMGEALDRLNLVATDRSGDIVVGFPVARGTVLRIAVGDYYAGNPRRYDNALMMTIGTTPLATGAPVVGAQMPVARGPANDDFLSPQQIAGAQLTIVAYNGYATFEGPVERDHGLRTVWYQWTAPANLQVSMVVDGAGFAEKLAVYMGEALDSLNRVAYGSGSSVALSFPAAAGTTYRIALGALRSTDDNNATTLKIATTAWVRSGAIVGPAMPVTRGPANDHFAGAQTLSGVELSVVGYNGDATIETPTERNHGSISTWYAWTAPANLEVSLSNKDSKAGTQLTVYLGDALERLNLVAVSAFGSDKSLTFRAAAGTTYRVVIGSPYPEEYLNATVLNLTTRPWTTSAPLLAPQTPTTAHPPNDDFANARALPGAKLSILGYNGDATRETLEPNHGNDTLWYTWTAAGNGTTAINAGGSTFSQHLAVYTGTALNALTRIVYANGSATSAAKLTFDAWAGTTYRILFASSYGEGSAVLNIDGPGASQFAVPGTYSALIGSGRADGYLQVTISRTGAVSGKLVYEGKAYALSGKLDAAGVFAKTIVRAGLQPLQVVVRADWSGQTDGLAATVTEGNVVHAATLERAGFTTTNPSPQAGRYTILIEADPAATDPAAQPRGFGYGTLIVSTTGSAVFTVTLADGTKFTHTVLVTKSGQCPLYVPLHSGAGSLSGQVTFRDRPGLTDLDGTLTWRKPALRTALYYKQGFTTQVGLGGARFTGIPAAFVQQSLEVTLSHGNLPAPRSQTVPAFVLKKTTAADVTLSVNVTTGLITGSFLHPVTRTTKAIYGVVFAKQNAAAGYFPGKDQTGSFELTE